MPNPTIHNVKRNYDIGDFLLVDLICNDLKLADIAHKAPQNIRNRTFVL